MSVTAVPLHPLGKGTISKMWIGIALVLLIGAGLAWLTTTHLQFTAASDSIRYRILNAGSGAPLGKDDLGQMDIEVMRPDGRVLEATARRVDPQSGRVGVLLPVTLEAFPPPMAGLKDQLRQGGVYQLFGPASELLGPQLPPDMSASDQVEFRIHLRSIDRGGLPRLRQRAMEDQARQQQMFQQQMREEMERSGASGGPAAPGPQARPGAEGPALPPPPPTR